MILTKEEHRLVTKAFITRLKEQMSCSGCNDVFHSEFPASVCEKFQFDFDLLEAWKEGLKGER